MPKNNMSKNQFTARRYLRRPTVELPLQHGDLPHRPERSRQETLARTLHSIRGWLAENAERDDHTSHEGSQQ